MGFVLILTNSCKKKDDNNNNTTLTGQVPVLTTPNSGCDCDCGDRGWIPLNSKIQVNKNNSISIQAPTGWIYIGYKKGTTQLLKATSGGTSVSCTCNTTGSCLPFTGTGPGGSTSGCAGNCTNCTMTQSAIIGGTNVNFESGGYINIADRVDFANKDIPLPAAFKAMFDLPEVKKALKDFIDKTYAGLPFPKVTQGNDFISVPDGYSLAAVSIFGRAAMVPVPTISLKTTAAAGGGTASCSCTQGTCTLESTTIPFIGSASYCTGSCSGTCTLSSGAIIANGVVDALYSAISFRF